MKFGLFKEFPSRDDVTEKQVFEESFALVDAAEDMRVEQLWLAEYHFNPIRSVLSAPITVASAIAARTKRMKIGLAVHVLPLRNPVIVAEEIATLDHISQGRLDFGIGRSTFPTTYDAYGIPYSESRGRFQECLDIILKGWTTERFSYEGQYYKFQDVCVVPKPFQKPPPHLRRRNLSRDLSDGGTHGISDLNQPLQRVHPAGNGPLHPAVPPSLAGSGTPGTT